MTENDVGRKRDIKVFFQLSLKIINNPKLRIAIQVVWIAAIMIFIFLYLWRNWNQFLTYNWSFNMGLMVVALFWALVRRLTGGIRWVLIALYDIANPSLKQIFDQLYIYFISGLANYIPGSLWYMVSRVQLGRNTGVSTMRTSVGVLYEMALLTWSGTVVGAYAAIVMFSQYATFIIFLVVLLIVGYILLMLPVVANRVVQIILKILKRPSAPSGITARWGWIQFLVTVALWLTGGLVQFYALKAFIPTLPINTLFYIISSSALAWTIGFLAPWAPSGLGVRDGILVWLLELYVPAPIAIAATVAVRLASVFEDLFWSGIALLFFKKSFI